MPLVIIQAGHSAAFPPLLQNGGGAPGEAGWTTDLAQRMSAKLRARSVDVTLVGSWLAYVNGVLTTFNPPAAATQLADLFLSLHYDAAVYGSPNNTGGFADRQAAEKQPTKADRFIRMWEDVYFPGTGIPNAVNRRNVNTYNYYAFRGKNLNTPGAIIEHGCGSPVPASGFPKGQDSELLYGRIDMIAALNAAAILNYLGINAPTPLPTPTPTPVPEALMLMTDWQLKNWVLVDLYSWAGISYNPESGTAQGWVDALRDGKYLGRPRTEERPYGENEASGVWVEFDHGVLFVRSSDNSASWVG